MSSIKRGKVFIFNIYTFPQTEEGFRYGSEQDVTDLTTTFTNMNAVVQSATDLTYAELENRMQQIKVEDFSAFDYVAIVYSSHGSENTVAATRSAIIKMQRTLLVPLFKNPTLFGKFKWLIIQTCRGKYRLSVESPPVVIEGIDPRYHMISYATSEGLKSYRNQVNGTYFLQCLCTELTNYYQTEDIKSILNRVRESVMSQVNQRPSNEDNFGEDFSFTFFHKNAEELEPKQDT